MTQAIEKYRRNFSENVWKFQNKLYFCTRFDREALKSKGFQLQSVRLTPNRRHKRFVKIRL